MKILSFILVFLLSLLATTQGAIEGDLYCGSEVCYDVINANRDFTTDEIKKAYRQVAREHHPDRVKNKGGTPSEIEQATERFQLIVIAYETLKDPLTREEYDYYLDHPEEYYYNRFRYYRRKVNVDVRLVVIGIITVISVLQYVSWYGSYNSLIISMLNSAKYRKMAKDEALSRGLLNDKNTVRKKNRKEKKTKEELREEEDQILREIIEENADIRGGYRKPNITDTLWVQITFFPYFAYKFLKFHIEWFIKYKYKKLEYSEEDKTYLIQKYLKLSELRWTALPEKNQNECFTKELWIKANAEEYVREKEEEKRAAEAESSSMKSYRRWMKKGGPGRMTFMED